MSVWRMAHAPVLHYSPPAHPLFCVSRFQTRPHGRALASGLEHSVRAHTGGPPLHLSFPQASMKTYTPPAVSALGDIDALTGFTSGVTFADFIILLNGSIVPGTSNTPSTFSCEESPGAPPNPDPRCN